MLHLRPTLDRPLISLPRLVYIPRFPLTGEKPIYVGIYVDDFVYFSEDPTVERSSKKKLDAHFDIGRLGEAEWFLGTHFEWALTKTGGVSVHLSQSTFAQHTVKRFGLADANPTLGATPYRSEMPINAVPPSNLSESEQVIYTHRYQSLIGLLN